MKVIKQMSADLMDLISEELEKREEYFDNKSEKWQESEKGESYQELTDQLQLVYDEIENLINIE